MARPKLGESDTERLHLKITTDELKAIDDWRYHYRVPSRSEAVRRLVQVGLRTSQQIVGIATDAQLALDRWTALTDAAAAILDSERTDAEAIKDLLAELLNGTGEMFEAQLLSRDRLFTLLRELLAMHGTDEFAAMLSEADAEAAMARTAEVRLKERLELAKKGIDK